MSEGSNKEPFWTGPWINAKMILDPQQFAKSNKSIYPCLKSSVRTLKQPKLPSVPHTSQLIPGVCGCYLKLGVVIPVWGAAGPLPSWHMWPTSETGPHATHHSGVSRCWCETTGLLQDREAVMPLFPSDWLFALDWSGGNADSGSVSGMLCAGLLKRPPDITLTSHLYLISSSYSVAVSHSFSSPQYSSSSPLLCSFVPVRLERTITVTPSQLSWTRYWGNSRTS